MTESDLTYLRGIAESGERAPLLGGRFFVWWGGLAAVALLAHWYVVSGRAGLVPDMVGFIWLVYGVVGGTGSAFLKTTLGGKPGAGAVSNRGERAVWNGVTGAIVAHVAAMLAFAFFGQGNPILFDTIPLVAFGGYGVAFWAVSALGGPGWMRPLAFLAWSAAAIGGALIGTAELYLYAAAVVLVMAVIPGALLIRNEPAAEQ